MLALAGTGCRAARRTEPAAPDARSPGASAILAGFDPAEPGSAWRAGDRVLFALSTASGTRTRTKLIELELLGRCTLDPGKGSAQVLLVESIVLEAAIGNHRVGWHSDLLRVAVRVYEADGAVVQSTEAKVPETVLQSGLVPALELCAQLAARPVPAAGAKPTEPTDQEVRTLGEGVAMLPTLVGILQEDSVLKSLLMQVVGPPPLLSILRGVEVGIVGDLQEAVAVTDPGARPGAPAARYRVPVRIDLDDEPALDLELEVAVADPPQRLSGGIVALRGKARRDPERTVTLELLAARRGPPDGEIR